jgi:SAM-dependent methyltransferase
MFFPSAVDCLREMLRVLKPGGRMALAVWYAAERNPFDSVVSRVVDRYAEPLPPKPGSTNMFRFATPGDLMAVLANAGASATSERILQFSIRAGLSAEEFWTLRSEMSEKLRSRLAPLSNSQREALERDAIEAIRAYSVEDRISIPAEVLIVSGRKPSA